MECDWVKTEPMPVGWIWGEMFIWNKPGQAVPNDAQPVYLRHFCRGDKAGSAKAIAAELCESFRATPEIDAEIKRLNQVIVKLERSRDASISEVMRLAERLRKYEPGSPMMLNKSANVK